MNRKAIMTKISCLILSCLLWMSIAPCAEATLVLVDNGKARVVIVLAESASASEKWAAQDLAAHTDSTMV